MDIQVCRMRAESYGYNLNDVVFAWTQEKQVDMAANLTLPQFSIMGHRYISCTKVSALYILIKPRYSWRASNQCLFSVFEKGINFSY